MLRMLMVLVAIAVCAMTACAQSIMEDFGSNPTTRGWVDDGPVYFAYGPGEYLTGQNIKRHVEEAIYYPLGVTWTQDDAFAVRFDALYLGTGPTSQVVNFGFFNADTWFENGSPDTWNASDAIALHLSQYGGSPTSARFFAKAISTSGDERNSTAAAYSNDTWFSHVLTYTPNAGANGAGQVEVTAYAEGDYGGTAVFTRTVDLQAGDTFSVNAFGMFCGHGTANSTDGLTVRMDDVTLFVPPTEDPEISEDFVNDPQARGWIDASPAHFVYGPSQYVSGNNVKRHLEEAYYIPLGRIVDQEDSFAARFDMTYTPLSFTTNQSVNSGFFDANDCLSGGVPDVHDPNNRVAAVLSHHGGAEPRGRIKPSIVTYDGNSRDASSWAVAYNQWTTHFLTYTAGAGVNEAGRLTLSLFEEGEYQLPYWSTTVDLEVGDTFMLDSFGIFTGHTTGNSSDGFNVKLRDVEVYLEPLNPITCGQVAELELLLDGDVNEDCYVNALDLNAIAAEWLGCTDPEDPCCDQYWWRP